jgi:putative transposase
MNIDMLLWMEIGYRTMPRKLRLEYPGAIYHVMNRGEDIVLDDSDRRRFEETLGEACGKTGWQVHAWCLMRNHFHLVVETPQANLVAGMQWLLGTYTARFNRRHKFFGHLFSGRYKSLIVDGSGDGYLKTVCDYVHLNPARAKLLKPEQRLSGYVWSSYPWYLQPPSRRPVWLRVDRLLGESGVRRDDRRGRLEFQRLMEQRRQEEPEDWKTLRRGWCWGDAGFREKLLGLLGEAAGEHHYGEEVRESAEAKGERLVAAGLARAGWREADLELRRKGDGVKVELAARLRRETTLGWHWIAKRLHMGHWRTAANAVRLKS